MSISLLDVIGPIMIGPSSSHTAGAAKLAKVARIIYNKDFKRVVFYLGGSFAKTYKGHFTDIALVAGALLMNEDDENLVNSFEIAKNLGVNYDFIKSDINSPYENSLKVVFINENNEEYYIEGASLGGGRILITNINGLECEISAQNPTIIVHQQDVKGVVSNVSTILACNNINIAVMKVSRISRGDMASCVIECDSFIPLKVAEDLKRVENVISVTVINI